MNQLKKAVILSVNEQLKSRLISLLDKVGIYYHFEEDKYSLILDLFDVNVHAVFIDIDPLDQERFFLLKILKKIRPRLNVFVILNDLKDDSIDDYLEAGASYCLLNIDKEIDVSSFAEKLNEFEV